MAHSTPRPSSPLRTKFQNYMTLRGYSPKTKRAYVDSVAGLAYYYNRSPDRLTNEQIQSYLLYLIEERRLAWSSVNVVFSGLRCFYRNLLHWDETQFHIPSRPRQHKLPMLLSKEEVKRLVEAAPNLKDRALLMTVYGGGLRVSEVVVLKPRHIESARMMIRVEQGKGRKDRYTILPVHLLHELKAYYRMYRPDPWLFPGKDPMRPMPVRTAQKIYHEARRRAGVTRGRGIHTLRHCFATHYLEQGKDLETIRQMLGHRSLATTCRYLHMSPQSMQSNRSPLDALYDDH